MTEEEIDPTLTDHGPAPYVLDIESATEANDDYRRTIWTGGRLQVTVMAIAPGDDIGLEVHQAVDQFLRVESGQGKVQMGPAAGNLIHEWDARDGDAIFVPAGTWHNVTAVGAVPLSSTRSIHHRNTRTALCRPQNPIPNN